MNTCSVSFGSKTFADYVGELRTVDPVLAEAFAGFSGIDHVLDWMKGGQAGRWNIDMVAQDEFHYDFLAEVDGRWLSFGVT